MIKEEHLSKYWILKEFSEAQIERIKFIFHLSLREYDKQFIPDKLSTKTQTELDYLARRTNEVMSRGGNRNPRKLSKQRPGIIDTGIEKTPKQGLQYCKGGFSIFQELLEDNWKITNAFWTTVVTQQRLSTGHGLPKKNKVIVEISKDVSKGLKLEEAALKGIERLMVQTWKYFHEWHNGYNKEIVLSFTGKHWPKYPPVSNCLSLWEISLPE